MAADAGFAAACETGGLTFIGPSSNHLRTGFKAGEVAQSLDPDARLIEFQVFGDQHGNAIQLSDRDGSIQRDGRKLLSESPAPSLDGDLRARMAETAVKLAREIGYRNAATIRFLLKSDGQFHYLGGDPFLSTEHAVTEAATGLDLVQLQIEIAEGRRLPTEAPRACGHAIGASLHADGAPAAPPPARTLHVWQPPPATLDLRIDAGVGEGMQVPPFDPLLAWLIAVDAARDGAIRKLSHALEALWIGGVSTNQELLLQILKGLNNCPLEMPAQEVSDIVFAAACSLYLEVSRHAQQAFLPGVPPGYRNNPYRDPSMALRIGTRDLALSWRRVGRNRYRIHSGQTELDGEVFALRPGTMSVVLNGILREFRFREIAEEVYVHSSLGSRVIQRLSRYTRPETAPTVQSQTVPCPSKSVASAPRSPSAQH